VVEIWNARTELLFYPTFRTALAAGLPWLEYMCPGCRQVGELDLREVDRHPEASISTLIPQLSCRRCCPNPPFAKLIRLKARRRRSSRLAHDVDGAGCRPCSRAP
jgi:hypothetical protein